MTQVMGWDVGGVNIKATLLSTTVEGIKAKNSLNFYPFWTSDLSKLGNILKAIHDDLNPSHDLVPMAITITAELSDAFQTKREGLSLIISCFKRTFPKHPLYFLNIRGEFIPANKIQKEDILQFAATNWIATALIVGEKYPNSLLIDIGSTTTDIIPIMDGRPATRGLSDLDRLISRELIYTGVLRATIPSILHELTIRGQKCLISFEKFALVADVHLTLGHIGKKQYTCNTADERGKSREEALARLARIVCADIEMLPEDEIISIATQIYEAQVQIVKNGIKNVIQENSALVWKETPVIIAGLGKFLAREALNLLDIKNIIDIDFMIGAGNSIIAPASCIAQLLTRNLGE
ncbi:MAG: hydantoinase/oxoprolinase family protein [Candidatus Helarchaeota archaeon]